MDIEKEDEAEKFAQAMRKRRHRQLMRAHEVMLIVIALVYAVHLLFGVSYDRLLSLVIPLYFIVLLAGVFNGFGVFDHHAELRYRMKQMNKRLAGIEQILSDRRKPG